MLALNRKWFLDDKMGEWRHGALAPQAFRTAGFPLVAGRLRGSLPTHRGGHSAQRAGSASG
ncbi:hypothetical protein [Neorhizobium sp. 2083]|uniref:hypothetical protein n=1 Tax=Neorhizobium sp. 2083 TaxID=2817762 RepID=UPI00286A5A25|nr:hypothetical protein [Neorhizobium sp. 2083]